MISRALLGHASYSSSFVSDAFRAGMSPRCSTATRAHTRMPNRSTPDQRRLRQRVAASPDRSTALIDLIVKLDVKQKAGRFTPLGLRRENLLGSRYETAMRRRWANEIECPHRLLTSLRFSRVVPKG